MAGTCSLTPSPSGSFHSSQPSFTPSTNPSTLMYFSDATDHTEFTGSSPPASCQSFGSINHGLLEAQSHSQNAVCKAWGSEFGGPRELELDKITEAYPDNQTSFRNGIQRETLGSCPATPGVKFEREEIIHSYLVDKPPRPATGPEGQSEKCVFLYCCKAVLHQPEFQVCLLEITLWDILMANSSGS